MTPLESLRSTLGLAVDVCLTPATRAVCPPGPNQGLAQTSTLEHVVQKEITAAPNNAVRMTLGEQLDSDFVVEHWQGTTPGIFILRAATERGSLRILQGVSLDDNGDFYVDTRKKPVAVEASLHDSQGSSSYLMVFEVDGLQTFVVESWSKAIVAAESDFADSPNLASNLLCPTSLELTQGLAVAPWLQTHYSTLSSSDVPWHRFAAVGALVRLWSAQSSSDRKLAFELTLKGNSLAKQAKQWASRYQTHLSVVIETAAISANALEDTIELFDKLPESSLYSLGERLREFVSERDQLESACLLIDGFDRENRLRKILNRIDRRIATLASTLQDTSLLQGFFAEHSSSTTGDSDDSNDSNDSNDDPTQSESLSIEVLVPRLEAVSEQHPELWWGQLLSWHDPE